MIRKAETKDVPKVSELDRINFADPYGEAFFTKACADDNFLLLVSEEGGIVIGYALAQNSDAYELMRVFVSQEYRKTGVGKALLKPFCDKPVVLEVAAENVGAVAFYEHCGFSLARVRKDYYGTGKDALVCIRSAL